MKKILQTFFKAGKNLPDSTFSKINNSDFKRKIIIN